MCFIYIHINYIFFLAVRDTLNPRKLLQKQCCDLSLAKTGTIDELRSRLLSNRLLVELKRKEVIDYAGGCCLSSSASPQPAASHSSGTKSQLTQPVEPQVAPSDGHDKGAASSSQTTPSAPILFGRQTMELNGKDVEDKTSFFAAIDEGPAIEKENKTVVETMVEATDGVFPLAAGIKISQGYQEELQDQIVVLLAGRAVVGLFSKYIYK